MAKQTTAPTKEPQKKPRLTVETAVNNQIFFQQLKTALGKGRDAEQYARGALTTIYTAPEELKEKFFNSDLNSLCRAILTAAQIGLDIDFKGHAYLVPYWNKDIKRFIIQLLPGYKGYIAKARESSSTAGSSRSPRICGRLMR